jgi:hypothetical protein
MPRCALVGVVSACVLFGASTLSLALAQDGHHGQGHAENHDWYQELKQPGTGFSCCNGTINGVEGDCRPTRAARRPAAARPRRPLAYLCQQKRYDLLLFGRLAQDLRRTRRFPASFSKTMP